MCTIILFNQVSARYPAILGANRDELYARPSAGPQLLCARPRAVGGRDVLKGGTWMGVSERGLFVGLTNQRTFEPADAALRSRGEVVLRALACASADQVERELHALDPKTYNAFNLLFGQAGDFRVAYARREAARVEVERVPRGIWTLPNDRLDSEEFPKVQRIRALAPALSDKPWPDFQAGLVALLSDHALPPMEEVPEPPAGAWITRDVLRQVQAICIHSPAYGTRSSAVVALEPGRVAHYLFADGPPCRTPLADCMPLFGAQRSESR